MDKEQIMKEKFNMIKCKKCGKYSAKHHVESYGTCLCGNVLDEKAKFKYEMNKRLRLWRGKNMYYGDYEKW